jgi:hypothetical protein
MKTIGQKIRAMAMRVAYENNRAERERLQRRLNAQLAAVRQVPPDNLEISMMPRGRKL